MLLEEETSPSEARGLTPAMRWTLGIALAVLLAGIAIWLVVLTGASPSSDDGAAPAAATAEPDANTSADDAAAATPTRGPQPGATPTTGSEVQTPAPGEVGSGRLPALPEKTPRATAPLPESAAAEGALVDGFPTAEMAPADGADVLNSAIATENDRMQVTLVARTDETRESIVQYYRQLWSVEGLTDTGTSTADLTFSDAFTNLSLVFSPTSGTGTVYSLYGVYRTN